MLVDRSNVRPLLPLSRLEMLAWARWHARLPLELVIAHRVRYGRPFPVIPGGRGA